MRLLCLFDLKLFCEVATTKSKNEFSNAIGRYALSKFCNIKCPIIFAACHVIEIGKLKHLQQSSKRVSQIESVLSKDE